MALTSTAIIDRSALAQVLATRSRRQGSDATIQTLIQQAEDKILAGGGEVTFLITAGGNSKSAMQESRLDAVELYTLANRALDIYHALLHEHGDPNGPAVSTTYADFSALSGFAGYLPGAGL